MTRTEHINRRKRTRQEKPAAVNKDAAAMESESEPGRDLRKRTPRSAHGEWHPSIDRRDPVEILSESSEGRVPHLVPLRYGRMLISPFAFYRGAAAIMAADLAQTPTTGLRVQACGDCHLLNFGVFATPERRLIFDINDFDETLPAPWEWDVKRLATSFVIAARHNRFKPSQARFAALACAESYRRHITRFAKMSALDVWYERVDVKQLLVDCPPAAFDIPDGQPIRAATHSSAEHASIKLLEEHDGSALIHDNLPLVYHPQHVESVEFIEHLRAAFRLYRESLPEERRVLLDRFKVVDHAVKVVGVGSVGTRCGILLLMSGPNQPLFLQVKEARPSVLAPYAGASSYSNCGERVVVGQRLMQAASDLFLGWTRGDSDRDFYVRQLRDIKIKPVVEVYDPKMMMAYARSCGWVLARAHARSGDPRQIGDYLGSSGRFDTALADFSEAYADQNEQDYHAFTVAIRAGRLQAEVDR
ncbi:MAG TPA: DUF2252 domain-containing protein [Pirellulales bacterium]|jgi:uncharacterized protein (DUF2252 family)